MDLQIIQNKIFEIRGCRVMLDFHLAELYQVETRALKQAVKRNLSRFPDDFAFQLTKDEWQELITICDKFPENIRHTPTSPLAFLEQGVAMLSSVLRSQTAIDVNISIMRAFVLCVKCQSVTRNFLNALKNWNRVRMHNSAKCTKHLPSY